MADFTGTRPLANPCPAAGPIPVLYLLGYALLGVASFLFPPVIWLPGVVVTAATLLLRWLRGLLW